MPTTSKKFSTSTLFALIAFSCVWIEGDLSAASGTWNVTFGGNWDTSSNWTPGPYPDGVDEQASFTNAITSTVFIPVNIPITVGGMDFDNSSFVYNLQNPGPLTFDTTTTPALITISNGTHQIFCPVVINDNLQINTNNLSNFGVFGGISEGVVGLSFTKAGTGSLFLQGTNTYTGGTNHAVGTIVTNTTNTLPPTGIYNLSQAGTILSLGSSSQVIGNLTGVVGSSIDITSPGTTLTFGSEGSNQSFSGVISGSGNITKVGSGIFDISGANTFSGQTEVAGGTIRMQSGGSLSSLTLLNLSAAGAVYDQNGFINQTIGNLTGVVGSTLQLGPNVNINFTIGDSTDRIFNGVIDGGGNIIKQGFGKLTLSGVNTYSTGSSSGTTINAGTISISNDNNLGATTGNITFGGNGTALEITNTMSSARMIQLGANNVAFVVTPLASNATFSGTINGSASPILTNLAKLGPGTLTLSGTLSYTGTTLIADGTLALVGVGLPSANYVVLNATGTFDIAGTTSGQTLGSISGSAGSSIALGNQPLTLIQDTNTTLASVIVDTGSGEIIMNGSAQLTLSGTNTYQGGTTINSGTIAVSANANLGSNSSPLTFTSSGGTLLVTTGFSASRTINIPNFGDTATFFLSDALTLSGSINGNGSLIKDGSSTLTISGGPKTYSGGTTINQGTLAITNLNQLGTGDITFGIATPTLEVTGTSTGSQVLHFGSNTGNIIVNSGNVTFNGGSDGSGGQLIKDGPGSLTLGGTNSYTAGTTINNGTLFLLGSLHSSGNVSLNGASSIFNISGTSGATIGALSSTGSGTVQLGSQSLTLTSNSGVFNGTISDSGSANGNLTLSNNAFLDISSSSTGNNYGSTYVGNANMNVDGTITNTNASSPNFTVDGSLTGIGTINGDVLINGQFFPGDGSNPFHINGSYTQGPGSFLEVIIYSPSLSSQVVVNGPATIDPSTTVLVSFKPGTYTPPIQWTVIDATSITGSTITIQSKNPLAIITYEFTLDDLILLTLGGFLPFDAVVTQGNPAAVAACVDSNTTSTGSDFANIISSLQMTESIPSLYYAFNQMQPTAFKALPLSQQEIFLEVQNALSHRYTSFYTTACNERELCKPSIWFDTFGSTQTQNGTQVAPFSPEPGYTTKSVGALFGVDSRLTSNFHLGVVTGYSAGFTSMHLDAGHGNIQSIYLGPYAKYGRENEDISPYADLSLLGEFNWYDTHREIHFGTINREASSDHTGQGLLFHIGGGAWIKAGKIDVSPFVNFDLISMAENSYHESGADSLNLYVSSAYYQMTQVEGGVLARTCFKVPKGIIVPQIGFSILHENRTRGSHYEASLSGTDGCKFKVRGYNPDRTLFVPEAELKGLFLNNRFTASLYYQGKYGEDFTQSELGFQFAWNF